MHTNPTSVFLNGLRYCRVAMLFLAAQLLAISGFAQIIAQYAGTTTASTATAANTTNTVITLSNGTVSNTCTAPINILRVSAGAFNQTTPTHYLQFTVKPVIGYQFTVNAITVDARRTSAGPPNGRIDYNANNSGFSTGSNLVVGTTATACQVIPTFTRTLPSVVVNDANNGLVVRVYFWATTTATGNLDFANVTVNGTVEPVTGPPVLTTPSSAASSITNSVATIGATIVANGNAAISERGTVYRTTPGVTAGDNPLAEGGTGVGAFSHQRVGLLGQTLYYFKGYAVNANGTGLSPEGTFRTLSNPATAPATGLTATPASASSIDLTWAGATFPATGATKYGYLVLRSFGTPALVASPNAQTPASVLASGTTLVADISSTAPTVPGTMATASGLPPSGTFNFTVIPYTWDGTNSNTYHYLTAGAPTATATITPTVYTWVGADVGAWTTASNWSPVGVPGTNSAVEFNNAPFTEVTNVPAVTLAWLKVKNSSTVYLTATSAVTINLVGGQTQFELDASSSLYLAGASGITINLNGGTGSINGYLTFQRGQHRMTATTANSITFESGAAFNAGSPDDPGFGGSPFGTTGTANIITFKTGSSYFHNEGANPFGLTQPASKVVFETGTDYYFQLATNHTASMAGRSYGNVWIVNGTIVTAGGSANFTCDLLYLEGGSNFTFNGSGTGAVIVNGDISADDFLSITTGSGGLRFDNNGYHEIYGSGYIVIDHIYIGAGSQLNLNYDVEVAELVDLHGELFMNYSYFVGTGNFTTQPGSTLHTAVYEGLGAAGNIQLSGTVNLSTGGNYIYDAFSDQEAGEYLPSTVESLIAYNILYLNKNLTATTYLEINDVLYTGAGFKVTIPATSLLAVNAGYVNGTLEKGVAPGFGQYLAFEIGDDAVYAPLDLTFDLITTGGLIAASTTAGDHPNIGTSNFDTEKTINRYWTLANNGVAMNNYALNAYPDAGEVDPDVNMATIYGGLYNANTWTYPTSDYSDDFIISISGMTGFGDLQFGQCQAPTILASVTNVSCPGAEDGAIDITVTGGTPPVTFEWSNFETTEDLEYLVEGEYSIVVSSLGRCTFDSTFIIGATGGNTYYADTDGDNYGDPNNSTFACTTAPTGYVLNNTDCNDANANINPGATDVCNNLDDDCDGMVDDGQTQTTYYVDADGDNFGTGSGQTQCSNPGAGYATANGDCNDSNANIYPGANESCNNIDDDCDGAVDENLTFTTYYTDADGDTYGTGAGSSQCSNPGAGFSTNDEDCDDANASVNPAASEVCNNVDDDCDGAADENLPFATYYTDADGDTYGTGAGSSQCSNPGAGFSTNDDDCDDTNAGVNPAATEICYNGIDENCNTGDGASVTYALQPDCTNGTANSVELSIASAGLAPYTYSSDGATYQTSPIFANLAPGDYAFTVLDAEGCESAAMDVNVQPLMSANASVTNVLCNGAADGTASLTLSSGGYAPYAYIFYENAAQHSTGSIAAAGNSVTVNGLAPGAKSFAVTDSYGCSKTFSAGTIGQPSAITVAVTKTNATCFGANNGSATASASGGTGAKTYAWSNGQSGATATNLAAGNYTVTATDQNGCTKTESVSITQPAAILTTMAMTRPSCFGGSNGTARVTATGGTGSNTAKTYLWNTGATTRQITGLAAGWYYVTVTDVIGCTKADSVLVTQPTQLAVTLATANPACPGSNNGSITATVTGGSGAKTYLWSTGGTTNKIINLAPAIYTVTVRDVNLCSMTAAATLVDPPALQIDSIRSVPGTTAGRHTVTVYASGGTGTKRYRRSTATGFTSFSTNSVFANLVPGTYTFQVSDSKNCTTAATTAVPVPPPPFAKPSQEQANNPLDFNQNAPMQASPYFEIAPNPATGRTWLLFRAQNLPTGSVLEVRDQTGRLLRQISGDALAQSRVDLSLEGLPSGVLFLSLKSEGTTAVTKRLVNLN